MRIKNVIIRSKNYLNVLCVVFFSIASDCNLLDIMGLNFKTLTRRIIASDKLFIIKRFILLKNPQYNGNQRGLGSIGYKVFDKKYFCYSERPHSEAP